MRRRCFSILWFWPPRMPFKLSNARTLSADRSRYAVNVHCGARGPKRTPMVETSIPRLRSRLRSFLDGGLLRFSCTVISVISSPCLLSFLFHFAYIHPALCLKRVSGAGTCWITVFSFFPILFCCNETWSSGQVSCFTGP